MSPVYFDLRVTVSFPHVLKMVSDQLWEISKDGEVWAHPCPANVACVQGRMQAHMEQILTRVMMQFDVMCGVPYTALPFATGMSLASGRPMIMRRKEAKDYGTKKMVEGMYKNGDKCLIVEDVVTSGASVNETSASLREEGLVVTDAVVLLDREQGGPERIAEDGVKLRAALTVSKFIAVLEKLNKLDAATCAKVREFVAANRFGPSVDKAPVTARTTAQMSYAERCDQTQNAMAKQILTVMEEKKTNLCVAADYNTCGEVLALAEAIGPHICVFKTHVDVLADFTPAFGEALLKLAEKHRFLIFEDRKFADIGNTVSMQYAGGVYKIADWSHITNAHTVPGPGIIDGLAVAGLPKGRGLLLLGEMSSSGTLAAGEYTRKTVEMAEQKRDFCMGFICTSRLSQDPGMLHMTPGVQLEAGTDSLGQRYLTPEIVLGERASDIIIVGRGIYRAADPAAAAVEYKARGWAAYESRLAK